MNISEKRMRFSGNASFKYMLFIIDKYCVLFNSRNRLLKILNYRNGGDILAISEFSFSIDDFQNPKVYKDSEAIAVLLTRLLLLEPGTIQSHPDAGVGIYSRYAYSVQGSAEKLQGEFQNQIETYMPTLRGAKVTVTEKDSHYRIAVEVDDTLYGIYYDTNTSKIISNYTKLSDL